MCSYYYLSFARVCVTMVSKCVLLAMLVGVTLAYPRPRAQPRPQHPQQQPQQLGIPPHLLRQYLAEAQQQRDSTPIYEQEGQNTQVLPPPGQAQQIRFSPVQRLVQRVQQPQYQPQYQPQSQPQYQAQSQPQYQPQSQPQGQVIQYPQPAPPASRPQQRPLRLEQEEQQPEDYDPNPSYQFGFDVNDDQFTNYQNRKEQREGNVIKGSYSVVDSDGFIRTVTYTADPKEGFKAEVSRTPTDIVVKVPTPKPQEQQPLLRQQQQQQQQQQPQQYYRYN